jgi:hypothetical protein
VEFVEYAGVCGAALMRKILRSLWFPYVLAALAVWPGVLAVSALVRASRPSAELSEPVYVRNLTFCSFAGHVVSTDNKLRLVQKYPLYEDDPRDGIWSRRLMRDPMDGINFVASGAKRDRHGLLVCRSSEWLIHWFSFRQTYRLPNEGRLEWDLATVQPEVWSSQRIRDTGIAELLEHQVWVEHRWDDARLIPNEPENKQ